MEWWRILFHFYFLFFLLFSRVPQNLVLAVCVAVSSDDLIEICHQGLNDWLVIVLQQLENCHL